MSPRTYLFNIKNYSSSIAELNAIKPEGLVILPLQPNEERTLMFESNDHTLKMEIITTPGDQPESVDSYTIKSGGGEDYTINASKQKGYRLLEIINLDTGTNDRTTTNVEVGIDEPPGIIEKKPV